MYVLDTDTISLYFRGDPTVVKRANQANPSDVYLSEVTVEELLRQPLADIRHHQSTKSIRVCLAYSALTTLVKQIAKFQILPYDERAETLFRSWGASVKLIGSQDCRIAACAMVNGFRVVTRNQKDFARLSVPFEDWSANAP